MAEENKSVETMGFEEALAELEAIVGRLESGQGTLEDAISAYERGSNLKTHCQKKLEEARMKVEKIRLSVGNGSVEATEFES
ncbi:MAG: exodeoxyribonuclease VII small subunit [Rhodospirillaceae bacterium]|nr:exodeoxyribonuclease VII small subunit [Rhodospirillaceae bacterium]